MPDGNLRIEMRRPDYAINALETATGLLAAMVRLGPASLTKLAAEAQCSRVNAFRILHTLAANGLATQDGRRGPWRLGVGWLAVGRAAMRQGAMEAAVSPLMAALARSQGMTVILSIREGEHSEVIAVESQPNASRVFAQRGDRGMLHAGSGRLLLAYAPAAVQRAVLESRLPKLGPACRIDPGWIATEIGHARGRGWLITTDEVAEGVVTISVPVKDQGGEVMAVLSMAASTIRMRAVRPHTYLQPLQAAAEALGKALESGPAMLRT